MFHRSKGADPTSPARSLKSIKWEKRGVNQLSYTLLRILESQLSKRVLIAFLVVYVTLGVFAVVIDLGVVCINPRLYHDSDGSLTTLAALDGAGLFRLRGRESRHLRPGDGTLATTSEDQLVCASPYSKDYVKLANGVNAILLFVSVALALENLTRMLSVSHEYFFMHRELVLDFVSLWICVGADVLILFVLHPKSVERWKEGHELKTRPLVFTIFFLRVIRVTLVYRLLRALRWQVTPGGEIARTIEIIEKLQEDMKHIEIKSVEVVKNQAQELRNYDERRRLMYQLRGKAVQRTLFFGSCSKTPDQILSSVYGLDRQCQHHGPVGDALYGAERPSYVDSCYAYTDWAHDPSGRTRKMIIFQALVGEVQELGQEKAEGKAIARNEQVDSICSGPWLPPEYRAQELGLLPRDVASNVYALLEARGQTLLTAVVTYENPEAFDEIEALEKVGARDWLEYAKIADARPTLNATQAAALRSMEDAIERRSMADYEEAVLQCQSFDVPAVDIEDMKRHKSEQSIDAGISLAFLLSEEFRKRAVEATENEDPTFRDMKKPFFLEGDNVVGAGMLCPRDYREGCAFVDTMPAEQRRQANLFLSWVWGYKLSIIRSALQRWADSRSRETNDVFLYMCFFCNNQWRILRERSSQGSDNLETLFEQRLLKINRMVALMDRWSNPVYLERIWTIFEQFEATRLGIPMEFVLPEEPSSSLIEQLDSGKSGIEHVIQAVSSVDAANAKATMPSDELKVKELIQTKLGFDRVNEAVRHSITQWIALEFKANIDKLIQQEGERVSNG